MISVKDSKAIYFLKVVLLLGVIFGHMNPDTYPLYSDHFRILSLSGITNIIQIFISYVLAHATVPTYFLLSGYLFWNKSICWNWQIYYKKIKSRVKTLLIPFLIWNMFSILTFVLSMLVKGEPLSRIVEYITGIGIHGFWDYCIWGTQKTNLLGLPIHNSGPFVIAFWYVRDLMVAIGLTPILFWFLRKTKGWILGVLFFCYWSKIWPPINGFSIDAIFFFSVGLFLAINNRGLIDMANHGKYFIFFVALILSFCCTYYNGVTTQTGRLIFPLFAVCMVWSYINMGGFLSQQFNNIPNWLVRGSFFVYALHACPIANIDSPLSFINTILATFFFKYSGGQLLYFFSAPFVTALFCFCIFLLFEKFCPKVSTLFTGLNIKKQH